MSAPFSYDVVAYQSHANAIMHPERLAVQGRLFGLSPAEPERCRYLEIGAGTGTNVIAAALYLPDSEFVGLDLAESAVREGTELIAALGLTNVRLEHADLTRWQPDGTFDYVAAHGVYSWVPAPVRDGLLDLYKRALSPNGIGYVSYNTLPGCHLRRVIWDMLKFHTANVPDPVAKLGQVDQFLQFVMEGQAGQNDPPNRWLLAEAKSVYDREERYLTYHDDLATVNDPVYFLDFAGHAIRHGLKYLAEASLPTMSDEVFPQSVANVLGDLGRQNPLMREQYRDFLMVRRFRTSLVCHAERPTRPTPAMVDDLFAASPLRIVGEPGDGQFVTEGGGSVIVDDSLRRRLLTTLINRWPARVPLTDLATGDDLAVVAESILTLARASLVNLHTQAFPGSCVASDRPSVSPLARWQAAHKLPVSTLLHTTHELTDQASRVLLPLLDGTRSRTELTTVLQAAVPTLGSTEEVADGLEITLQKLVRAGMLVG